MKVKELFDVASVFLEIVFMGVGSFMEMFVKLSIVLFIIDGIKAKRQQRKRKAGITVMFIISIILDVLAYLLIIGFFVVLYMAASGKSLPFTWPWFK